MNGKPHSSLSKTICLQQRVCRYMFQTWYRDSTIPSRTGSIFALCPRHVRLSLHSCKMAISVSGIIFSALLPDNKRGKACPAFLALNKIIPRNLASSFSYLSSQNWVIWPPSAVKNSGKEYQANVNELTQILSDHDSSPGDGSAFWIPELHFSQLVFQKSWVALSPGQGGA